MALPSVRTGPRALLGREEILRLAQFPAVRERISAGLSRTRVLGVDFTPGYVVFRLQDPSDFHPALFATVPLGSRGTMATIGTPRAAVRDARRLAEALRSRGWVAGERRWLRTPDESERRSMIYQLRQAGIVGGSRAQRVLIPRSRVEAALRAFATRPVRVAANSSAERYAMVRLMPGQQTASGHSRATTQLAFSRRAARALLLGSKMAYPRLPAGVAHLKNAGNGRAEWAIVKGGKYLTMTFTPPSTQKFWWGPKAMARTYKSPAAAAKEYDLILSYHPDLAGGATEAFSYPNPRRCPPGMKWSSSARRCVPRRASRNPILATIGFNPGSNPLTREEKKRLTAIARDRASLGVLAARELGDDQEALERSAEYEVGRYFGGSDMAREIRDTFTRRRAAPPSSPNPVERGWSMHDAAQRSVGLGKPYSLHLAVLHKSGFTSYPVAPWKHDLAITAAKAMERTLLLSRPGEPKRTFGPALVVWPVMSPMQGQLPYLHRVDLARAVRGTAADVERVQTGAARRNPLSPYESSAGLGFARHFLKTGRAAKKKEALFRLGQAAGYSDMVKDFGVGRPQRQAERLHRAIASRAHRATRNPVSGPVDQHAATELELYVENDAQLHRSQEVPIIRNLMRRRAKGTFNFELSVRLWQYLIDAGARKYVKEFGHTGARVDTIFNKATRQHVARRFAQHFVTEAELGNYDKLVWGVSNNPARRAKKALDVYVMGDQPTTCPKCGSRTEFVTWSATREKHVCPRCKYRFVVEHGRGGKNPLTRGETAQVLGRARAQLALKRRHAADRLQAGWHGGRAFELARTGHDFGQLPVARTSKVMRAATAAANAGLQTQSINIPFRDGQKITPERMRAWLASLPAGAVKDMLVRRFEQGVAQYRKFHLGSEPKTFTYKAVPMGAQKRVTDVDFVVSEGKEWAAPYQVPKHSEKYQAETQGRYLHSHGESGVDVTIKRPAKFKNLPERFHTADGKFVGVIPGKVKITDWYRH